MGRLKINTDEWIKKASLIRGNEYDYSKGEYINSKTKIKIICSIHGEFFQTPVAHLNQKQGCPYCGHNKTNNSKRKSHIQFIEESNLIHKNLYDYSITEYIGCFDKVKIICKKHGEFLQTPDKHLQGQGCPICKSSKGELLIRTWLKENDIKFKEQFELITSEIARDSNLMKIDFFIIHDEKQYFIEYDGIQHFEYNSHFHREEDSFFKQQRRDLILNEFCELHKDKVTLIRFNYNQTKEEIINKLIEIFN